MARSRGRAAPARRPAPAPRAPPPAPHQSAPPPAMPQQGGGGMLSGIGSSIAQGMALGTGSAMAHRAVDAVMGPREVHHVHDQPEAAAAAPAGAAGEACGMQNKNFMDCLSANQGNMNACQFYFDQLKQCQGN